MDINKTGCLICGKKIVYNGHKKRECSICKSIEISDCECENGHYICDKCHEKKAVSKMFAFLMQSSEKDPIKLFEEIISFEEVHMHGPEHHIIVPCVLLCAYKNAAGEKGIEDDLRLAIERGSCVPGGTCGYFGACGAAVGAGIYMSIITNSSPMHTAAWPISQKLCALCLDKIADTTGPRCCKRTCRMAIYYAAEFTEKYFGVKMPVSDVKCMYHHLNDECLDEECAYF